MWERACAEDLAYSEVIDKICPGEIYAIFGVECASGDTFPTGTTNYSMLREPSNSNTYP
jgi:hypothetical protein